MWLFVLWSWWIERNREAIWDAGQMPPIPSVVIDIQPFGLSWCANEISPKDFNVSNNGRSPLNRVNSELDEYLMN
jgi:hypothetical protein